MRARKQVEHWVSHCRRSLKIAPSPVFTHKRLLFDAPMKLRSLKMDALKQLVDQDCEPYCRG
eukprot:9009337-Pyramimonas_sp.AAC.1